VAQIPLILFSGLGADARMFRHQRPAFPQLVVPRWLPTRRGESLRQYAVRMARTIDSTTPCAIGGASFGGFLALEMLPYLPRATACYLIGAVRSPAEFPLWIRLLRPMHRLCRIVPFELFFWLSGFMAATVGLVLPRRLREFLKLGGSLDPVFFKWAAESVLTWGDDGPPPPTRVPVYHIQGERDRILPARLTRPDELVPLGGHVISLSNPDAVNAFLRRHTADHLAPTISSA
jgi:pimeloyl-ACP methyl ester carboxylesterase